MCVRVCVCVRIWTNSATHYRGISGRSSVGVVLSAADEVDFYKYPLEHRRAWATQCSHDKNSQIPTDTRLSSVWSAILFPS